MPALAISSSQALATSSGMSSAYDSIRALSISFWSLFSAEIDADGRVGRRLRRVGGPDFARGLLGEYGRLALAVIEGLDQAQRAVLPIGERA